LPSGGVAQLGERLVRNQKVVSSILITSTIYQRFPWFSHISYFDEAHHL
jgi:hypothetical protein